jgi:hypothetical protein
MTGDAVASSPPTAASLVAVLQWHLPQTGRRDLEAAVRSVLSDAGDIVDLVAFLRTHDDALTRSRSAVPEGFPALVHVLSRTVGSSIATPHCVRCRKPSFFLPESFEDGRICLRCTELVRRAQTAVPPAARGASPHVACCVRYACTGCVTRGDHPVLHVRVGALR